MQVNEFDKHVRLEDAHWWFRARRNIILTIVQKYCLTQHSHLVEIGCGTGGNLREFSRFFSSVAGIDISPDAVSRARMLGGVAIQTGDFRELLRNNWQDIDVILIADVLEHIEDDRRFLEDIVFPMKKNALLVATVPAHPHLWSSHDVALGHFRRYTYNQFRNLWSSLPISVRFLSPFNFFLYPVMALMRVLPFTSNSADSDLKMHSSAVNSFLFQLFNCEKFWLKHFPFPWGGSYITLVQKI